MEIIQSFVASTIAGFGYIGAGYVNNMMQKDKNMEEMEEVFIFLPSLLGLKGNIEMTMASRLSIAINKGEMKTWKNIFRVVSGNAWLMLCQATFLMLFASFLIVPFVYLFSIFQSNQTNHTLFDLFDLCAAALLTANSASFLLGLIMAGITLLSFHFNIDPDNIATPIASAIGDFATALFFYYLLSLVHVKNTDNNKDDLPYWAIIFILLFLLLLPVFLFCAKNNKYSNKFMGTSWVPIFLATIISLFGGFILDSAAKKYNCLAIFQPVMCGMGGNLASINTSRLSTWLQDPNNKDKLPKEVPFFSSPWKAFNFKSKNSIYCLLLLVLAVPLNLIHVFVIYVIFYLKTFPITMTIYFYLFYLTFAFLQVFLLLYLSYNLTFYVWSKKSDDPENWTIPLVTVIGDVIGISFLFLVFFQLNLINDPIITSNCNITIGDN